MPKEEKKKGVNIPPPQKWDPIKVPPKKSKVQEERIEEKKNKRQGQQTKTCSLGYFIYYRGEIDL